jgi:hypothetical protein
MGIVDMARMSRRQDTATVLKLPIYTPYASFLLNSSITPLLK